MAQSASAPADAEGAPFYTCALTGDRLFRASYPHEVVEGGLAYRVRGSMDAGLSTFGPEQASLPNDGDSWPLHVVDVVRDAGLHQVQLDRSGFVKHWQRYISALQRHVAATDAQGTEAADELLLRAHTFARKLMQNFDELDFLVGASEALNGPVAVLHYLDEDPLTPQIYFICQGAVLKGQAGPGGPPCPQAELDSEGPVEVQGQGEREAEDEQ
jgi:hypothetical protein